MNTSFTTHSLNQLPQESGVYLFKDIKNQIIYIGKAKNLKKRVSSYFIDKDHDYKANKLINQVNKIEIIPVNSEFEALLLEAKLINDNQPKYNVIWRDDKHYLYIKITKEKYPKILFTRKKDKLGLFFGPFPSAKIVREILSYLRTIFPYCTQNRQAKLACFYYHLGLCNPCPAEIIKLSKEKQQSLIKKYRRNVLNIKNILLGKARKVKKLLREEMLRLADVCEYEQAGEYRDKLAKLDYLQNQYSPIESYIENPKFLLDIHKMETEELQQILTPYYSDINNLNHIECFDISNISGKQATGSMVTFMGGSPNKNLYRRFKIILSSTPNDFAMLKEVMSRRLKHNDWQLPDLFIIDGGKPQLVALQKVLKELKVEIPMIGLAKEYEEIVIPSENTYKKIRLPENSTSLHLLKRIRDEAHRFAHKYHSFLRLKQLVNPDVSC